MLVKNLLIDMSLHKIKDEELCTFIMNARIYVNQLEVLLTPDGRLYLTKEKYSLEDLLSASIPDEVFEMHNLESILNRICVEVNELWTEKLEREKKNVREEQSIVKLTADVCRLTTEKNSAIRDLKKTLEALEQLESELEIAKRTIARYELALEKRDKESKCEPNNLYSSYIDVGIKDLFNLLIQCKGV